MEYCVIENGNRLVFEKLVKDALADGWELQGGVSISHQSSTTRLYSQAMTKRN